MLDFVIQRPKGEHCIQAIHTHSGLPVRFSHIAHRTLKDVRSIMDRACAKIPDDIETLRTNHKDADALRSLRNAIKCAGGHI